MLGQVLGTAAAMACELGEKPRGIYERHIGKLQQLLMDQDIYIPWLKRDIPEVCMKAQIKFEGEHGEAVLDGNDREHKDGQHAWLAKAGQSLSFLFDKEQELSRCRIVFDSDFSLHKRLPCSFFKAGSRVKMPGTLVRDFNIEILDDNGDWKIEKSVKDQIQRYLSFDLKVKAKGVRLKINRSWGDETIKVFSFEVR